MKEGCCEKVLEKYRPALRGFGKTQTTLAMLFHSLYQCTETEEEREWFRAVLEGMYGGNNGSCDRVP